MSIQEKKSIKGTPFAIFKFSNNIGEFELFLFSEILINNRDKKQVELTKEYSNKFTFGEQNSDSIFSVKSINPKINISIDNILIESNLFGQYNIDNIAAAICIGKYFNLDNENIKSGIERYIPENNRSQIVKKGSNKIILDAYNANPTSMQLALSSFNDMKEEKKIVCVFV